MSTHFFSQVLDELDVAELLEDAAEELGLQAGREQRWSDRAGIMGRVQAAHSRLCFAPPPRRAYCWLVRLC